MAMKNSKKQLIGSMMSLTLSATMLMGTTLAWFTDSATTTVNTIKAGNLDVELQMNNENGWINAEGQTLNFKTMGNELWEPGASFKLPELKISNKGNLALKFKLLINGVEGNAELAEVIDVYLGDTKVGVLSQLMNNSNGIETGNLLKYTETDSYEFTFKMQEDAGNQYKGKTLSGISFTVLATQDTVETDSFDSDYDKGAEYDKLTLDQVKSALSVGENFTFAENITVKSDETERSSYGTTGLNHTNGGVIDGNGKTLTVNGANGTWDSAIYTNGGTIKNLNVEGAFRGILTGGLTSDLIIDNVTFDNVLYTFNADGAGNYDVIVKNSTLNGWTSYTKGFKGVSFTNCNFGEGRGYAYLRPYNPTTLTNCKFSEGFELDARKTGGIVLKNCTVNGVAITQQNITTLLGPDAANATVQN